MNVAEPRLALGRMAYSRLRLGRYQSPSTGRMVASPSTPRLKGVLMVRNITLGVALLVLAASVAAGVGTAGSNGLVASATGSGQATAGGEQRTFAFTARRYADGSVKGEAQLNN